MTALKVTRAWNEYRGRGLLISARLVSHVGERVYVFDKNFNLTQHDVERVGDDQAILGTAIPFVENGSGFGSTAGSTEPENPSKHGEEGC